MNLSELKKEMPEIFESVKNDVRKILGRHRAGLSLGLVEMGVFRGGFIGGMHFHPGTEIVMNKSPLKIILDSQPYEIVWAYTYHILLHEYIHSLGVIDERQCRAITLSISEQIFREADHPVIILAKNGIGTFILNLRIIYIPPEKRPDGMPIEYVYGFDRESQSYFS
ncbi:MAG: hypothetical protein CEE42_15750 [Promethearchaeota archaeon Loki_b31]|nr:MAG: hypothetical protein CEE42_15750 [Candidatus Lokiarchaeota archaeon Loki_b31]